MSVSVSMPQLGESVTEGTVTRWLKKEGERVEADEPLLEVSTDKVDTEIPSPVSGILRGITVAEDETVAVGAELAVIDDEAPAGRDGTAAAGGEAPAGGDGAAGSDAAAAGPGADSATVSMDAAEPAAQDGQDSPSAAEAGLPAGATAPANGAQSGAPQAAEPQPQAQAQDAPGGYQQPYTTAQQPYSSAQPPYSSVQQPYEQQAYQQPGIPAGGFQEPASQAPAAAPPPAPAPPAAAPLAAPQPAAAQRAAAAQEPAAAEAGEPADQSGGSPLISGNDGPYVTPLVRKLAAEHGIELGSVAGTGVGGRIRKQDVIDAARALRGPGAAAAPGQAPAAAAAAAAPAAAVPQPTAPQPTAPAAIPPQAAPPPAAPQAAAPQAAPTASRAAPSQAAGRPAGQAAASRTAIVPSSLRGTTEQMSRARQLIAARMVESLQTSAQLTTVVEADVTAIARLRNRAKADFEAREGVKLSFLPFFALAAVEALKVHPRLNAVIDTASAQVTYHDAEHLGIAVDTDRGLMVPVIRRAGDLNIGGLARKIADLAERTRAGRVSPDDLSGGTFTLTNTGSRGALFDTPIINQPQVAILGTGTVVKRPVVVEDAALGEVITVRSMVYLALTYDHRLVDGADAARFLITMKARLEEGAFETELGL